MPRASQDKARNDIIRVMTANPGKRYIPEMMKQKLDEIYGSDVPINTVHNRMQDLVGRQKQGSYRTPGFHVERNAGLGRLTYFYMPDENWDF